MEKNTYHFNWQNPVLRESIYPFRNQKLIDFLLWFYEIDLWKKRKETDQSDPQVVAKIKSLANSLAQERQRLEGRLARAVQERMQTDKWFAKVSGPDEGKLRRKRIYYLDRQVQKLTEAHADLIYRQERERTKMGWYAEGEKLHERHKQRADELNPSIQRALADLKKVQDFRSLYDRLDLLPAAKTEAGLNLRSTTRWEVMEKVNELNHLKHDQLVKGILDRFDDEPERFPLWLQYMVIHFSGMRYRSAHGSWADPRYLLQLLLSDDLRDEIKGMDNASVDEACERASVLLQAERAKATDEDEIAAIDRQLGHLRFWNHRRALQEYRTAREVGRLEDLSDAEILEELKAYRAKKEQEGDPMPDWVWQEIVKYTTLRLEVTEADQDWEATSPERWRGGRESRRWLAIMNEWETKDITGWRKKHRETLSLIVTRSVCNEIAENIQHMRGYAPSGGLTAKPLWYLGQQKETQDLPAGHPEKAYFVQAPGIDDFKPGASILWIEWVNNQPNAWQVTHPISGFDFLPEGVKLRGGSSKEKGAKRGISKKDRKKAGDKATDAPGWEYRLVNNAYVRIRRIHRKDLKAQGKTRAEIDQILKERGEERQYLRWRHEATVVAVAEMVDDTVVLTFETGQIGLVRRPLGTLVNNPMVFVGYVPEMDGLPSDLDERLNEMLRRDRILPDEYPVPMYPTTPAVPIPVPAPAFSFGLPAAEPAEEIAPPLDSPWEAVEVEALMAMVLPNDTDVPVIVSQQPQLVQAISKKKPHILCWVYTKRNKKGFPIMVPRKPRIKIPVGTVLEVSTSHKESERDTGDGKIRADGGKKSVFYLVTRCEACPEAVGSFVRVADVSPLGAVTFGLPAASVAEEGWALVTPKKAEKGYLNCWRRKKIRSKSGRPIMRLPALKGSESRVQLVKGTRLRVSTPPVTAQNGKYYRVVDCPDELRAVGMYVRRGDITPLAEGP